jgi:hypothetical protein
MTSSRRLARSSRVANAATNAPAAARVRAEMWALIDHLKSDILFLFQSFGEARAMHLATMSTISSIALAFGASPLSAATRAQLAGPGWPQINSYLSRNLGCVLSKADAGKRATKHTLNCDRRKGGINWVDVRVSPDQRHVRALQTFVVLKSEDSRVPVWQVVMAHRSALRLVRFVVPDRGDSARWTDRAFRRTVAGRCMQAHHSAGYSLAIISISPTDMAIINAELTIAHGPSANPYLETECF